MKDKNGSVVAEAQAKFSSQTGAETRVLATNGAGVAVFELKPATYDVIITARGFWPFRGRIVLEAGQETKFGLVLTAAECPSENCIVDYAQESPPQAMTESSRMVSKNIDINSVQFVSRATAADNGKATAFKELRESKQGRVHPSLRFDVVCEISGELDLPTEDFFLWTTVDFLVAPVSKSYEEMETSQMATNVGWGQITQMEDLKAVPIYLLRAGETRRVVVNDFDLDRVLASFPVGNAGNLWPWLLRVNIHIQDRGGKQMASAARTVRLWPDSTRLQNHNLK